MLTNEWFLKPEWAKEHAGTVDTLSLAERFDLTYLPDAAKACSSVLDVGCGSGQLCGYIARLNPRAIYRGVDFSPASLSEARRRFPEDRFIQADGAYLPIVDAAIDLVYQHDVLMHHPRPLQMLSEMYRVSRRAMVFNARVSPRLADVLTLQDQQHGVLYQTLPLHRMIQVLLEASPPPSLIRFRVVEMIGMHPTRFAWDRRPHYRTLLGFGRQFHVHAIVLKGSSDAEPRVENETRLPLWAALLALVPPRRIWRYLNGLRAPAR